MLKPLTVFAALTATTTLLALAAPAAHAAGLSPNLSIHTTGLNTTTMLAGRNPAIGHTAYTPPPNYGGPGIDRRGTTQFDPNH
jgi:hypothetical protein